MRTALAPSFLCFVVAACAAAPSSNQRTAYELPSAEELGDDSSAAAELLRVLRTSRDSSPAEFDTLAMRWIVGVQMHLGKLGFGAGPFTGAMDSQTEAAIRRFENARHLAPTGNPFNRATFAALLKEGDSVSKLERSLSVRMTTVFVMQDWHKGHVLVQGRTLMDGSSSSAAARIDCSRQNRSCEIVQVRSDWMSYVMPIDKETVRIAAWDDVEILSEPLDYFCARYRLRITRAPETAAIERTHVFRSGSCDELRPFPSRIATREESWTAERAVRRAHYGLFQLEGRARELMLEDSLSKTP